MRVYSSISLNEDKNNPSFYPNKSKHENYYLLNTLGSKASSIDQKTNHLEHLKLNIIAATKFKTKESRFTLRATP